MAKNQLFRINPDLSIVLSILETFGLDGLGDTKFFTKCSIKDIKVTSEKLYEDNVIADPTAKSKNKTKSKTTKTSKSVKAKPKK